MSWNDIDLDLIVPGMITKGPAAVSFADYLNTFSRALDERLNMLIPAIDGEYPELPNILFEVGEIRTQNSEYGSNFWDKLKDLIQQYYLMWSNHGWYTVDIMADPVNYTNYLLDDSDLIDVIGQSTFDVISDVQNKSILEYFTANVIKSMYEIYKLTKYTRVSIKATQGIVSESFLWSASTLSQSEGLNNMTGNASRDDNYLSFAAANSEARSGYLADRAANEIPFGGFTITDQATGFVRKEKTVEGEPEDVWGGNYAQAWDLVNIYSRYRDLSDAPLIMEVSASCLVTLNFKGSRDEEFSTPLNFYGPYDTSFPQIDPGDSNIEANSDSLLAEPVQVAFGTKRVWSGNNGAPMPTPSLAGAGPAGEYYNESQQFAVTLDQNMSTNINHPDLEFFIP